MQDTTSSAMTEVALGLSMAFFTLLIVALLSLSVPKTSIKNSNQLPISNTVSIESKGKSSVINDVQFIFYFNHQFYDQTLALRDTDSFTQENPLVIAVDPKLTFAEVVALKQQIKHDKLSITTLSTAWHSRLQQMIKLD
jgi:biopolymer transport protein ExbD